MVEIEKTYLAKFIPVGLCECKHEYIEDTYFGKGAFPKIRLRKKSDKFEFTKKIQIGEGKASHKEMNIKLTGSEYNSLKRINGRSVSKTRYYYPHNDLIAEIDVFDKGLKGLVIVEFEFPSVAQCKSFEMPDFCLLDVTEGEEFRAGAGLAGKAYSDIEELLLRLGYSRLS